MAENMDHYFRGNAALLNEGRRTVIMPATSLVCESEEGLIRGMEDRGYDFVQALPGPKYVFRKAA